MCTIRELAFEEVNLFKTF